MNRESEIRYNIKKIEKYNENIADETKDEIFNSFLVGLFSISLICSIDAAKEEIYYNYLALIECSAMVRSIIRLVKNITKKTIYEDKIEDIKEELGKLGYYYDEEEERGKKR